MTDKLEKARERLKKAEAAFKLASDRFGEDMEAARSRYLKVLHRRWAAEDELRWLIEEEENEVKKP